MTIRRGVEWGTLAAPPTDLAVVSDDAELGEWLARRTVRAGSCGDHHVGVRAGDLARTVGGGTGDRQPVGTASTSDAHHSDRSPRQRLARWLPCDALAVEVELPGGERRRTIAGAHVVARRRWWRGEVTIVGNTEFVFGYDALPGGHPNDGWCETLVVGPAMSGRARWQARRRARLGAHLPHPDLRSGRSRSAAYSFATPTPLWVDGRRWATVTRLHVDVIPDAYTLVV